MGTKTDKELEKGMKQVLSGLYDLRQDQMEKQYKKHWSEIKVPFSLHDGLSKFTKYELDAIRKNLYLKNASSLKKAELIALLQERIPEYLEQIYLQWDDERFKLLTKIADNGGYIVAPDIKADQIDYFRASGLIYTGTFNGKKILAVPDELIGSITALKNNVKIRAMVKRNTEWIKLTRGLLYYYGTLSTIKLVDMLEKYTEETLNFGEYVEVIENANTYRKGIYIDEDGFSNSRVFDPKRVKREHKARKNISFYPFSKHQLLTAGEPEFVDRNESYVQLVRFFTQNFEIDKVEADRFVEECVYATKIGESPNDILQYLGHTFEFDSLDTVQALMDKVVYLMNNTREWFLKGYTSTELSAMEKKHIHPLPTSASNQNESANTMKIGRNEPCPCGSGKKYKKCCGR